MRQCFCVPLSHFRLQILTATEYVYPRESTGAEAAAITVGVQSWKSWFRLEDWFVVRPARPQIIPALNVTPMGHYSAESATPSIEDDSVQSFIRVTSEDPTVYQGELLKCSFPTSTIQIPVPGVSRTAKELMWIAVVMRRYKMYRHLRMDLNERCQDSIFDIGSRVRNDSIISRSICVSTDIPFTRYNPLVQFVRTVISCCAG